MGLFSRHSDAPGTSTSNTPRNSHQGKRTGREGAMDHHLNRRPPFGLWMRTVWLDLLTMVFLGAVGLGVRR
jgi:hypothetical protein